MKNSLLAALPLLAAISVCAQDNASFEDAYAAVDNMRIGWNLGNTLDANSGDVNNMWIEAWTERKSENYETSWGQPVTTPALIKMFKDAGFNTIRVPVTWYPHMGKVEVSIQHDSQNNYFGVWEQSSWTGYDVDEAWMARVHEIVDYVIDQDMYCILNVHHDTGSASTAWLHASTAAYNKQKERFESLWTQIATEFRDYGERLLFEGYNEMLDDYGSWCFASFAAPNNYNASSAADSYSSINKYAQSFVDAVRATGGNNAQRNLIVNTYAACCGEGNWNSHLIDPLREMKLPADPADGKHIIFEIHSYPSVDNLNDAKSAVDQIISKAKTYLVSKGAPVIFGEWGTSTDVKTSAQRTNLNQFARYMVEKAKENHMATVYWMVLSDGEDRSVPQWSNPTLKDAIVKGYYGEEGYQGIEAIAVDRPTDNTYYNLQGIKVANPTPGIYIHNGQKVLVK